MSLITLTTDFGLKDHFVGAVKGAIYTELPTAIIVDISHDITPFNIAETAYLYAVQSSLRRTTYLWGMKYKSTSREFYTTMVYLNLTQNSGLEWWI